MPVKPRLQGKVAIVTGAGSQAKGIGNVRGTTILFVHEGAKALVVDNSLYSACKGAVIALTRAMAIDHGKGRHPGNCVAPGPVYTPMVYARGMGDERRERPRQANLLKIGGKSIISSA